jgi:hypothetical protein
VRSLEDLKEIESRHQKTWLFYTLPIRAKYALPEVFAHLKANYTLARVLPGTLGGGDITILSREQRE